MGLNEAFDLGLKVEELRARRKKLYADIEHLPKEKCKLLEDIRVLTEQKSAIELYISEQKETYIKEQLEAKIKALQVKLDNLERVYSALLLKKNKLQPELEADINLLEERNGLREEIDNMTKQKEALKDDIDLSKVKDLKHGIGQLEREYSILLLKKNKLYAEVN